MFEETKVLDYLESRKGQPASTRAILVHCGGTWDNATHCEELRSLLHRLLAEGKVTKRGTKSWRWSFVGRLATTEGPETQGLKYLFNGNQLIVSGNTYEAREMLKGAGLTWNADKKSWVGRIQREGSDGTDNSKMISAREHLEKVAQLEQRVKDAEGGVKVITLIKPDGKKVKIEDRLHPAFEHVLFHVNCGDSVMLVGPKGCGKTHLCEQVAKVLKLTFSTLSLSGGVTESKLFGRVLPNVQTGEAIYHTTPFVEAFESGGVFLLDEVDAADPNVLLSLNSALANGFLAVDGYGTIERHKDFVCIAAANTWGHGADRQYVGRMQQDGAFVERFVQLGMDYDEALERALCPEHLELVEKLHRYRANVKTAKLERSISTRLILRAVNWMKHGKDQSYVDERVFDGWREDEIRKVKG